MRKRSFLEVGPGGGKNTGQGGASPIFHNSDAQRAALRCLAGGLPVAVAFFAYNLHYFDKLIIFGQVTALAERAEAVGQVTALAERVVAADTSALWKHSFSKGLAGVLVSSSRGLLVYSPIFIVSVWAASRVWKDRRWLPLRAAAIAVAGIWFVTARWSGWWGGWCYGYRLVVDTAILLAFLAIPVAEKIRERRTLTIMVSVLVLWSVGVQVLGAFVYDVSGWNEREGYAAVSADGKSARAYFTTGEEAGVFCRTRGCSYGPVAMNIDNGRFNARLWSIRDSQIVYYLQNIKSSRLRRLAALRQFLNQNG